ncbi:Holliday junction branch migration protein RuvA [Paremcibacter congregatus]|uniref:Holliday junction branch migration protein RuvA n=1 Tax=Paremcibacter congregatus TaxID=2043170 RepID=UPI0030EB4A13|tara:strand:- start:873 stop:1499 length:627 start_codon:yes stop_codon:yes gene_type:complete
MIAKLKGLVDTIGEDYCVIDVNGVGYLVFCSGRTLGNLPSLGEATTLLIETHVREDHIHLFGFSSEMEKQWFILLQTVQGVGAKVALAILSVISIDELSTSIAAQDKKVVGRATGVGPKLATRIITELKDKVAKFSLAPTGGDKSGKSAGHAAVDTSNSVLQDAASALVNLGYGQTEAYTAVSQAARGSDEMPPVSTLIRLGLKELSQ